MKQIKYSTIFTLVIAAFLITACSGSGSYIKDISPGKRIYVEDNSSDRYGFKSKIEFELAKLGLAPTSDVSNADLILKWNYIYANFGTEANVRLTDLDGNTIYLGEGRNPGWGTKINKADAIWGCIERSMEKMKL